MSEGKKAQLEVLKHEEKVLTESIERYMSIDLKEMEQATISLLKEVQAKIKEIEES